MVCVSHISTTLRESAGGSIADSWADVTDEDLPISLPENTKTVRQDSRQETSSEDAIITIYPEKYGIPGNDGEVHTPPAARLNAVYNSLNSDQFIRRVANIGIIGTTHWNVSACFCTHIPHWSHCHRCCKIWQGEIFATPFGRLCEFYAIRP